MPIHRGPKLAGTEVNPAAALAASPVVATPIESTPPAVATVVHSELARPAVQSGEVTAGIGNAENLKPFEGDLQQINPEEASYRLGPYSISRSVTPAGHEIITITSGPPDSDAPGSITADRPVVMLELRPKGEGPAAMVVVGLIQPRAVKGDQPAPQNPVGADSTTVPEETASSEMQKENLT